MRRLVLGVIGHVDHGKTSLVRALTGMETDRLPEEQRRGISIARGFAHARIGGGEVDFVDMPGHERFVRTMASGATGINAALLVVAANEGVMPQTREHVDIAGLLGVGRAVIAVTKADLVPPGELEAATREAVDATTTPAATADSISTTDLLLPCIPMFSAGTPARSATASSPPEQTSSRNPSWVTSRAIAVHRNALPA